MIIFFFMTDSLLRLIHILYRDTRFYIPPSKSFHSTFFPQFNTATSHRIREVLKAMIYFDIELFDISLLKGSRYNAPEWSVALCLECNG